MSQVKVSGNASGTGVFTIAAPNSNSNYTLTLPQASGNLVGTGDTGTVSTTMLAAASVTQAKLETLVVPLGVGQTWTNVSGSRSSGVTYTNSTGKPIQFVVTKTANGGGTVYINGSSVSYWYANNNDFIVAAYIVPNGATYSVSGGIGSWYELR